MFVAGSVLWSVQVFIDLITPSTHAAYVKLIVSCLDYEFDYCSLSKVILQKALTSTCEPARRWCTKFLSTLAHRRPPNFSEWGFRLLLGQLADQSVKVIRHAIRILHTWLPVYKDAARWLRTAQLDNFGEAGILLKVHIYRDEHLCLLDEDKTREIVLFWLESFNVRYVEAIDDDIREALFSIQRTIGGTFSRSSGERAENFGHPAPPHLFAALCSHEFGRNILCNLNVIDSLVNDLLRVQEPKKVKATLMALGHIGSVNEGFKLLPPDVVPQMVRLAEESAILSVRGYGFWALNILSLSVNGAAALARLGWESNRFCDVANKQKRDNERLRFETRSSHVPQVIGPKVSTDENSTLFVSHGRSRSISMTGITSTSFPLRANLPLRRTKSSSAVHTSKDPKKFSLNDIDDVLLRHERDVTWASVLTGGFGSTSEEGSEAGRRTAMTLDSMVSEWESRSRTSTIVYCLNQGFIVNRKHLILQGTVADLVRDPHFANAIRDKWKLAPLKTKRYVEVNQSVGDHARYVYMTRDEELSLSRFRREMLADPWLFDELCRFSLHPTSVTRRSHLSHVIALPSDIDVMCSNIFPSRSRTELPLISQSFEIDNKLDDRGARSGHGRSQRSNARIKHSAYRCFYCSSTEKGDFVLPLHEDVAQLRREVLNQVDMLEIQQSTPEKKLLMLRKSFPWLFEWPCLYADVLELLDEYRFKSKSRAFLQEIFYDALRI
ncbi:hypothetical protein KIN20_031613 [Parelaphostrongylus tenuis]|uniref:Rapamycin-insensitive companion of mTOR domain-containing protein n=1 Tax=Parelaphostrongylus tenuis TaxID=148309 RepID=A0AAD5R5C4_PARTN|nr:hypothetical protein KIN20_031613 [Parelaphostrongylus tenuis]